MIVDELEQTAVKVLFLVGGLRMFFLIDRPVQVQDQIIDAKRDLGLFSKTLGVDFLDQTKYF